MRQRSKPRHRQDVRSRAKMAELMSLQATANGSQDLQSIILSALAGDRHALEP
jgi:hypothetical protein